MRRPQPTGVLMDLGNLPEYWGMLASEFQTLESLPALAEARLLSDRAFDESQVAGPRTYMAVERYLGVARDNHEALLALLEHRGATVWAPWSLLRPIFEASFFATWIIDPSSGRERRLRGLRSEVQDFYQRRKHRAVFKRLPQTRRHVEDAERKEEQGQLAVYRSEAAALGESFDRVHQRINVAEELLKLNFVRGKDDFAVFLEGTWRLLSGFEHGLAWALLRGADRGAETEIPGGKGVVLSINDNEFVNAAKVTYALLATACRLLKSRHLESDRR
ncbi:hypothetical protein [Plantactinospora sp. WMMB782]|uniref:hypothetical protein n=1 Tax=Plantactinospora sp. WMMB782 TaxID=3404121 RepID=UPI003B928936